MAGHQRHIFHPVVLLMIPFGKMKAFCQNKNCLQQIVLIFPNLNFFRFLQKKLSLQTEKRHFYEIISFNTNSTANLSPLLILKKFKFFSKKTSILFKNTQILNVLRNLNISIRQICHNLVVNSFHYKNRRTSDTFTSDFIN